MAPSFGKLIEGLGLTLPSSPSLRDLIDLGWITPLLRVEIPAEFYLSWKNFPLLPPPAGRAGELEWAGELWTRLSSLSLASATAAGSDPLYGKWYCHFLDDPELPVTRQAREAAIATGPQSKTPEGLRHRGCDIRPWIDYFAYWQVYELDAVLRAARLPGLVLGKDTEKEARRWVQRIGELQDQARTRVDDARSYWARHRRVFEWLSHYRTLYGIWDQIPHLEDRDPGEYRSAVTRLAEDRALTVEQLRKDLRDTLLVLDHNWRHRDERDPFRQLLRQDITMACLFLRDLTGEAVDFSDPYWSIQDRGAAPWTQLADALPLESVKAEMRFPEQARIYLKLEYDEVVPNRRRMTEERLRELVQVWSKGSPAFRRFLLAFWRLHSHYGPYLDDGLLVRTTERTPEDFLVLSVLQVERVALERWCSAHPLAKKFPEFAPLLRWIARRVKAHLAAPGGQNVDDSLQSRIKTDTRLHGLKAEIDPHRPGNRHRADPFRRMNDFTFAEPRARFFLKCMINFALARNYAAHHDCLDDEIRDSDMGQRVVEALLVVVLAVLDADDGTVAIRR